MKPQEGELVSEISKLQCMVSELKTGVSSALLELSQIQHGDAHLREELEDNRRTCQKKALRLEALVETLRAEMGVMQSHVLQLYRDKPRQEDRGSTPKHRDSDSGEATAGRGQCVCCSAGSLSRGKILLHCYLQGLKAGLCEGTDARHQVAMQLLHSEWEYVSTLNQLYDKYRTPPTHHMDMKPYQAYVKFVEEMLQRHLHFRNTLQERLSAEHWKSLVGDIIVQLIGQNDTSFTDMYLGYTTTLATFLSVEFNRIPDKNHKIQMETEELKLLSLLLAPISRIHSYLNHVQNLLQWTGKDHPDCSLLLGTEKVLRRTLSRCHVVLEEDVRWENRDEAGQSCSGAPLACCSSSQSFQTREKDPLRQHTGTTTQREDLQALSSGCRAMHLECWSCSPVRRGGCGRQQQNQPAQDLRAPDTPAWGENSDSGQGTSSQPAVKGSSDRPGPPTDRSLDDCETDPDDTSAFDYSSVTSCSPDGTLGRAGSHDDEEDSQVPVLLKPTYKQRDPPRERTVCLRWQIPSLSPHPPTRRGPCVEGSTPCLVGSYGKRLLSVRQGSPPLHPKSAFRPIWDDPTKQGDSSTPEKDRQGFVPIQAPGRQSYQAFNPSRDNNIRPGMPLQRGSHVGSGLWDESEDSEGPCSTV